MLFVVKSLDQIGKFIYHVRKTLCIKVIRNLLIFGVFAARCLSVCTHGKYERMGCQEKSSCSAREFFISSTGKCAGIQEKSP